MSRGGAEHLARIHGTEEDKVNCPFYFKIGACRHSDKCSRQHHRPPFSQTILIPHMWNNPFAAVSAAGGDPALLPKAAVQEEFDEFYEEIFEELIKFGEIEDIQVCENLGEHMVGNVYVKFEDEEFAQEALMKLHGRFYAGKTLTCEYSPVTDFKEARCRQHDESMCGRGGFCNFMHIREPSRELRKHLENEYKFKGGKMKGTGSMGSINNRSGPGGYNARSYDDRRERDYRDRDRDRDRERDRDRDRVRDRDPRDHRERDRSRDRESRDRDRNSNNKERLPVPGTLA